MKIAKMIAGILAGATIASVAAVPAMAAGNIEVVPASDAEHIYSVYQLLSGEHLGGETLWDIHIADDIPDTLWDTLEVDKAERAPSQIAHWLDTSIKNDAEGAFAVKVARAVIAEEKIGVDTEFRSGDTIKLDDGFYVVTSDDAQPMMVLIGNDETLTITEKSSVPKMDKEIGEVAYDGKVTYGDAADTGIGKVVPYRITGTLPSNYNAYDEYTYNFRDLYDNCLVVDPGSVTVKVMDKDGKELSDITGKAEITVGETAMSVCFENLMDAYPVYSEGDKIVVDYSVTITEDAKKGYDPNENHAWIEYTRSPTNDELGKSEPDRCRLYTWELDLKKIAADTNKALEGAEFVITDEAGLFVNTDGTLTENRTDASIWKTDANGYFKVCEVDSGKYTLKETKAPEGYQSVGTFTVTLKADYQDENSVIFIAESTGSRILVESVDAKTGITLVSVSDVPDNPPPQTGDNTNMILFILLGILAVAGIAGTLIVMAERGKDKE